MTNTVNPITAYPTGVATINSWDMAIDCVNYPVYLKELFFNHATVDDDGEESTETITAEGITNTGRYSKFYGVVVDRDRTGDLSTISTVTGLYDTIPAAEVYETLRNDLEEVDDIEAKPRLVYVSGDGGRHELRVQLDGMEWVDERDVKMYAVLNTSVDASTRHSIRIAAIDMETGAEIVGVSSASFNLSTRHTRTIRERHAAFSSIIDTMVTEWNDNIIPMMELMSGTEFDKAFAVELLDEILVDSKIPQKHQDRAMDYYEKKMAGSTHNLYGVVYQLSSYFEDELRNKPEALRRHLEKISKTSEKVIKNVLKSQNTLV